MNINQRSPSLKASADQRKIALTDLETTGSVFGVHEILEIGLVVFDQNTFEILDTMNVKINPKNIKNAVPAALERNKYLQRKGEWKDAVLLEEAIKMYAQKTKDCIFCAYNATFDWGFMNHAFKTTGVKDLMDYHRLDLMSMALMKLGKDLKSLSMDHVSEVLGLPKEAMPHQALNGAMQGYLMYKKLMGN